jgi:hypothetical protein
MTITFEFPSAGRAQDFVDALTGPWASKRSHRVVTIEGGSDRAEAVALARAFGGYVA